MHKVLFEYYDWRGHYLCVDAKQEVLGRLFVSEGGAVPETCHWTIVGVDSTVYHWYSDEANRILPVSPFPVLCGYSSYTAPEGCIFSSLKPLIMLRFRLPVDRQLEMLFASKERAAELFEFDVFMAERPLEEVYQAQNYDSHGKALVVTIVCLQPVPLSQEIVLVRRTDGVTYRCFLF